MFCTPGFDGLAALFCSGDGLKPLFFPDCHCSLFHVCLLCRFSQRGRVFLRVVSKIHAHYMERFSHWETGLGKYAISWGSYVAFACIPWRSAALMRLASCAFWRISQHV